MSCATVMCFCHVLVSCADVTCRCHVLLSCAPVMCFCHVLVSYATVMYNCHLGVHMRSSQLCLLLCCFDWQSSYVKSAVVYAVLREDHTVDMGVHAKQCSPGECCYSGGHKGIGSSVHQAVSGIHLLTVLL